MIKIFTSLILVLVLSACQVSTLQVALIDQALEPFARDRKVVVNTKTQLYAFYRPFHVGMISSDRTSVLLRTHDEIVTLSVDVAGIILNDQVSERQGVVLRHLQLNLPSLQRKGTFQRLDGAIKPYELKISRQNNRALILLRSYDVVLTANTAISTAHNVVSDMMVMLRSASTANDLVLGLFSNHPRNQIAIQNQNLFNQLAPEAGTLAEMINLLKGPPTLEKLLRENQNLPNEEIVEGDEEGFE